MTTTVVVILYNYEGKQVLDANLILARVPCLGETFWYEGDRYKVGDVNWFTNDTYPSVIGYPL